MSFSGLVITNDKNTIYACTTDNLHIVSKYQKNDVENKWEKVEDLPRSQTDDTEIVLQLRLDKNENVLFGEYSTKAIKKGRIQC